MEIHTGPIQQRIEWLLGHAGKHSAAFRSPEEFLARERYLADPIRNEYPELASKMFERTAVLN